MYLTFCTQVYRLQLREGRHFLREHPMTALSWKEPCIEALEGSPLVFKARNDACASGMTSADEEG